MTQFSLLLPTRGRPALLQRLFHSIACTTSNLDEVEAVLYIDNDDLESANVHYPGLSIIIVRGARKTMGEMTQACYDASHGQVIALINDDAVFHTSGWDETILDSFSKFSDSIALVYANDQYYGKQVSTFPILHHRCCELLGQVVPAAYNSHCIDSHILDIFQRLAALGHDRLMYLPHVTIEHMYFNLGLEAYGETHADNCHHDDQRTYLSLSEERQQIALRLAEAIESSRQTPPSPNGKSTVSLIVFLDKDLQGAPALWEIVKDTENAAYIEEVIIIGDDQHLDAPSQFKHKLKLYPRSRETMAALAQNSRGDFVAFLHSSSQPKKGWLKSSLAAFRHEKI